jgi:hypothetical protein
VTVLPLSSCPGWGGCLAILALVSALFAMAAVVPSVNTTAAAAASSISLGAGASVDNDEDGYPSRP